MNRIKIKSFMWMMLLCLLGSVGVVNALSIIRGPYLQNGTETSVVIKWRTDTGSDSQVDFGPASNNLNQTVTDATIVTDHEITIPGLTPDTTYYYQVGSTTSALAGGDNNHYFNTHPTIGSSVPVKIWAIGDAGYSNSIGGFSEQMYAGFKTANGSNYVDVWLMLGDNAYSNGTDSEFQTAVFEIYTETLPNSILWSTRGNHENNAGVYYGIFVHPTAGEAGGVASGSEAYYSFDYANIHFICLDSDTTSRSVGGAMYNWMIADLADTTQDWIIAFWHHPAYSRGSHNSDTETRLIDMRTNFLPPLEDAGVDLVLMGHSHGYERSYLLDGHYGNSSTFTASHQVDSGSGQNPSPYTKDWGPHNGAVYVTSGNASRSQSASYNHPAHYVTWNGIGSILIEVDDRTLNYEHIKTNGAVQDSFTIIKNISGISSVDAGIDMITWSGRSVDLDATVVYDGVLALTHAWSADPASGVVFSDPSIVDPTVTITKATTNPSVVTLTLAVNEAGNPDSAEGTMIIDVYDDACKAAIGSGLAADYPSDFYGDCITGLEDLAFMLTKWLTDNSLTAPVPK